MIRKEKRAGKKYWILTVFAAFIAIAMSFVSWLIYAVFSQSYREIKQQYYGVVSRQIVEDIENSIRNGKQIERFYGMDKVLSDMLAIISTDQVPVNTSAVISCTRPIPEAAVKRSTPRCSRTRA